MQLFNSRQLYYLSQEFLSPSNSGTNNYVLVWNSSTGAAEWRAASALTTPWTPYKNLDLGTTGQVIKNAAGTLGGYFIYNNAAATRYVKLYDKGSAPTNSDTPKLVLAIPGGGAANIEFADGINFGSGISARATTGVADNDTGAPTSNDVVFNCLYT